jgi:hypothetical protein
LELYLTKTTEEMEEVGGLCHASSSKNNNNNDNNNNDDDDDDNYNMEQKSEMALPSPIPGEASRLPPNDHYQLCRNEEMLGPIPTVSSLSLEKEIDHLMEELGQMDAERIAILEEINNQTSIKGEGPVDFTHPCAAANDESVRHHHPSNENISSIKPRVDPSPQQQQQQQPVPLETPPSLSPRKHCPADTYSSSSNILNTTSDSVVIDQTLSLLYTLKDLMTCQDNRNEREASVWEQLEVLSELMQDQSSGCQSFLSSPQPKGDETVLHPTTSMDISHDNDDYEEGYHPSTTWISGVVPATVVDPWPALVSELTSRCEFLEQDRKELARITEDIMRTERESNRVAIQAAVATAQRQGKEKLYQQTQEYHRSIRTVYQNLCYPCQQRVYSMLLLEK